MKIGHVDIARDVLVIAEIGNNHEGDLGLAEELISLAARAGAHAVKFQTIRPEELVTPDQEARLAQLRRICIPAEAHERLAARAAKEGVMFISTPFYLGAVDLLEPLVPAYKIASGDNNFIPLLKRVGATGKPILLSTGMADMATIKASVDVLERRSKERGVALPLVLLHCVSAYPTPPHQANLRAITTLASLGYPVGYSDHTLGTQACVMAVTLGARVLEKHFTISKNHSDFRDHKLSSDPDEMRELVERVREANVMLGDGDKRIMKDEQAVAAKRSIVCARDLPAGHRLGDGDLVWMRPADGLAPGNEDKLLGRKLRAAAKAGQRLNTDMVEG